MLPETARLAAYAVQGGRARDIVATLDALVEDAARARGRTGGRKPKLNDRQAATVRRMYQATGPDGRRQHTVAEIAEAVGVHRTTVYDYLKKER